LLVGAIVDVPLGHVDQVMLVITVVVHAVVEFVFWVIGHEAQEVLVVVLSLHVVQLSIEFVLGLLRELGSHWVF